MTADRDAEANLRITGLHRHLTSAQSAGKTSAVELTQMALDRIAASGDLNAVIRVDADGALHQALSIDRRRRAGEPLGPLAGIPALIKDNTDVRGMPTTHGSLIYATAAASEREDSVVTQLRNADAVIVGKSNLSEFAMEAIADNRLFGPTHNPWRAGISPGGSSGGSAAALAAGLTVVATATDGGGSTRIPAALCGLVGLKPTSGVAGSSAARLPLDLSSTGPMAQTLADLRMLADLTLRPAHGDPSCVYGPGSASIDRPVGTVFAASRIAGDRPIDPAVEAAFVAAASAFGRSVERDVQFVSNGILDSTADEVWATIYAPEDVFSVGRDVLLEHYELLDPRITSWVDRGMATTLADYLQARQSRCDHVRKLDELLDVDSVLLCPILTTPAYAIDGRTNNGRDDELMPIDVFNTAALNLTGHPGLTVPAGSLHGIPTGLQIIGPRGSDLWLIEIAKAWERSHPWPLTAPGYDVFSPFAL